MDRYCRAPIETASSMHRVSPRFPDQAVTSAPPPEIRFSIFIPVWNGARWIPRAIRSLLEQTYPHWELVIGDNASDDDLCAIVKQFTDPRIRYHRWSEHTEIFENYNRTMQLCRFEWIQLLCCDDRLLPACLERLAGRIAAATQTNRLAMVIGAARRVD